MKKRNKLVVACATVFTLCVSGAFASLMPKTTAQESDINFDFSKTEISGLTAFNVGVDPSEDIPEKGYNEASWVTYQKNIADVFTKEENGIKVNTDVYTADSVDNNTVYMTYKASKFQYFEAEFTYVKNDDTTNGWAGIMSGYTDFTRKARWGDSAYGVEWFVQRDGKATYSSSKLNNSGYTESAAPAGWQEAGEHTIKLVANEDGFKFYADGGEMVHISKTDLQSLAYEMPDAYVGFFFTNANFTAEKFSVKNLGKGEETPDEPIGEDVYTENYDFTTMTADRLTMFSVGVDPATNDADKGYTGESWITYEKALADVFTVDKNGMKVNMNIYSGDDVSENRIYVRYNKNKYQYFKAELVYNYNNAAINGWAGFMFGYTNFARQARWGDNANGVEAFVQQGGRGTVASAALQKDGFIEQNTPSDWSIEGEHTIKIVAVEAGITLYADGQKVLSFEKAYLENKGYEFIWANMGFFFTNADFTAKSFSFSPLSKDGGEYTPVQDIEVEAPSSVAQYEGLEVKTTVTPANATLATVDYELPEDAVAHNDKIYFAKPGEYTVTVYSTDRREIKKEVNVTVTANEYFSDYKPTEENFEKLFDSYYTDGAASGAEMGAWNQYWTVGQDGSVSVKEKFKNGVDSGYTMLYLNDVVNGLDVADENFEITYMVKSDASTPNGWHGVMCSIADTSKIPNQGGLSMFIQEEALKATLWGNGNGGVSGPIEKDSSYTRAAWNLIRVKVYGGETKNIEMYVNDMDTPVAQTTGNITTGYIGLFATTTITYKNISYVLLDAQGNRIEHVYPEEIVVENPIEKAAVGDTYQLKAKVLPDNATENGVMYQSSNALFATVTGNGLISFTNAGTVTITITSKGDPSIVKKIEIEISPKEILPTAISFDATPTTAEVGGSYRLWVTLTPDNTTNYSYRFTSSNEEVATVDAAGKISYLAAGKTTITVIAEADENVKTSFELTVTAPGGGETGDSESGSEKSEGCGSATGIMPVLALGAIAALLGKKRKD